MSSFLALWMEESPRYEGAPNTTPTRVSTVPFYVPITSGSVSAEPQRRSRDDELRGNLSPTATIIEGYQPAGTINVGGYMNQGVPLAHLSGLVMSGTQGDGVNEVQRATPGGTVSGGTWDLTIGDIVLTGIPFDVTYSALQTLIDERIRRMLGASAFKLGDIVVAGGPANSAFLSFTFQGTHAATNVASITIDDTDLTGAGAEIVASTATPGSVGTVLLPDGRGVPSGCYRWLSSKATGITAQTATVLAAYSESAAYEKGQGFAVSQLGLDDSGNFSASMIGLVAGGVLDPSLTPSYDAPEVLPMMARDRIVTWQAGAGNISTFSLSIANPIQASRHHGIRSAFPGKMRYSEGFVTATGTAGMDEFDTTDRDSFLEATTFAVESHWQTRSKVASSGGLYEMFFVAPACQLVGGSGPEALAAKRRHEASYDWMAALDPTAVHLDGSTGYDFYLCFTSALTTLATFA